MRLIPVRAVVIVVTVILFVGTLVCVAGAAFGNWRFGLPTPDKTTVINTVVAVGAFVLVAWGVVVALAAYVSATGIPDLSVELTFPASEINKPVFRLTDNHPEVIDFVGYRTQYLDHTETQGTLVITNSSKYSARNPGVRITFERLRTAEPQKSWVSVSLVASRPQVLQWDGGTDYIIHGQWSRTLPMLDLKKLVADGESPAFIIDVAADGFGPETTTIPVTVLDRASYAEYEATRDAQSLSHTLGLNAVRKRTWRHTVLGFLKKLKRIPSSLR